jgi:hypothetical protein
MEIADLGKMLTGEEPLPVERSKIFGFIRKGG